VFGLADWHRDGTLAEYVAIEARDLAPQPGDVDFTVGASLPISGLTAWQGLFEHGRLRAGQSVIAHGAAGAAGSMVTQLARLAGAHVIGTGRGCGTDDCGRTSGPSRASTMPSPSSTRSSGARGRRSFAFVREDGETATTLP
jgi:NADPH:quinone reductase-like Zn-dependent oxidoreductase